MARFFFITEMPFVGIVATKVVVVLRGAQVDWGFAGFAVVALSVVWRASAL
ncbi:MAG TPA: hypothetical protein VN156_08810 [Pseudomonas sp.]|nr:hypothetical protein [Pseudomonas sp.]